ncbi:MAG TPA: hypothetical protein VGQ55_04830 [Pyrinomonadaceae bacterium]|jgi:hypothetical protein|nr:hypothetical protein [Pyrinomonadaceae bacterium]
MPLQNRVTPFGTLIATPERGTLMGNRGCLHDKARHIRRTFQLQRWIICLLDFKGRSREVMRPGHYTELFFLDEATALAAGHRPCAECQRRRFDLFRETWAIANPEFTDREKPRATTIDAVLHNERIRAKSFCDSIDGLPNGTFLSDNACDAYVVLNGKLRLWTPGGYEIGPSTRLSFPARILTPSSVVKTLCKGYTAAFHGSAFDEPHAVD